MFGFEGNKTKHSRNNPGTFCPLIKGDCVGWQCMWYNHLRGINQNTGENIDDEGCSIKFLPMLLVENAQQSRQTGAAVESTRNELSSKMDIGNHLAATFTAMAQTAQTRSLGHSDHFPKDEPKTISNNS